MATVRLVSLPQFSYTSLDFDSIIEDVKALIRENPGYNKNWDDFLESNAGRMFVETMAYITEKLASRVDWIAQEMFISTATQRQSIINLLKLINHRTKLPTAAKVLVTAKVTKWVEPFALPLRESIIGVNSLGSPLRFEVMNLAADGKPDYDYVYSVDTGLPSATPPIVIPNIPCYQGTTYTEDDIYMDGIDNESVTLQNYPVIENTVRIFGYSSGVEYPEVTSYITPDAQQNGLTDAEKLPPYTVEIDAQNRLTFKFGPAALAKICRKGERLKVMYRVGGGASSNVVARSINVTKTYTLGNNKRVTVIYGNDNEGFGGADEEDLDNAKLIAPIVLRSADKTVTREDYIAHLEGSPMVMHAQVVGKENEPAEILSEYGYSLPPLDSWIYVTPRRDDLGTVSPSQYQKELQIGRPYAEHRVLDWEDVTLTALSQKAYLTKYRLYGGYPMYVTQTSALTAAPYGEDSDYTFNSFDGSIARIDNSGTNHGTIPAGTVNLRVRYVSDETQGAFRANTVFTFGANGTVVLAQPGGLYPRVPVVVQGAVGATYTEGTDYAVNWSAGTVSLGSGAIQPGDTVCVHYANNWQQAENDTSEERAILDAISDKKMICVDNHIMPSRYTTFDVVATVYCAKNLRSKAESGLASHLRSLYSLQGRVYAQEVSKATLINDIMKFNGGNTVQGLDITYLGKNYEAYRRFVLEQIDRPTLAAMNADNVDHKIAARYNEILVVSDDAWDGAQIAENQRGGFIFDFKDLT